MMSRCDKCANVEVDANRPFRQCGGCKNVLYCSVKCQREDWKSHKYRCRAAQKEFAGFETNCTRPIHLKLAKVFCAAVEKNVDIVGDEVVCLVWPEALDAARLNLFEGLREMETGDFTAVDPSGVRSRIVLASNLENIPILPEHQKRMLKMAIASRHQGRCTLLIFQMFVVRVVYGILPE